MLIHAKVYLPYPDLPSTKLMVFSVIRQHYRQSRGWIKCMVSCFRTRSGRWAGLFAERLRDSNSRGTEELSHHTWRFAGVRRLTWGGQGTQPLPYFPSGTGASHGDMAFNFEAVP